MVQIFFFSTSERDIRLHLLLSLFIPIFARAINFSLLKSRGGDDVERNQKTDEIENCVGGGQDGARRTDVQG